jgi:hypothetical protein
MSDPARPPDELPFRTCGMCRKPWATRQDFITDPSLRLLGLQAVPDYPDANLLVYEHDCGTSVSVLASRLRDLVAAEEPGEAELPLLRGSEECGGFCNRLESLEACGRRCRNARDRRLTLWLAEQQKGRAAP